jgi:hypothetical protein
MMFVQGGKTHLSLTLPHLLSQAFGYFCVAAPLFVSSPRLAWFEHVFVRRDVEAFDRSCESPLVCEGKRWIWRALETSFDARLLSDRIRCLRARAVQNVARPSPLYCLNAQPSYFSDLLYVCSA